MLDAVQQIAADDSRLLFLFGLTCARIGAYERAESAFNSVLSQHPDDFDVLFNLGRAASRAQHYDRAERALDVALKLRPESVDALTELAQVSAARQDYTRAIYLLAQAKKLAPGRPEILLALARTAQAGAYYGDAALAYDEYLQLKPADDQARRDRGLVCGYIDARKVAGVKELADYVRKHPQDPVGHYNQAQLSWREQPEAALDQLARAVRLDPGFAAAHVDRAWLLNRLGRSQEAIPDLQKAVEINARDFRALDQLGLAYSSLDRPAEAEKALRRAISIAPDDPDILLHLGRALMELGQEQEATQLLERFQQLRPRSVLGPRRQAGMIESALLSAPERTKREVERLRQDARAHPDNPELQLHLASLLLTDGRLEEASAEFRVLLTRNVDIRTSQEAGSFLLAFEQYDLARDFLRRAGNSLDLAIALLFTDGPAEALKALDQAPEKGSGDYYLLKSSILDAAGESAGAEKALDQGMRLTIARPQIVQRVVLSLIRRDRKNLALDLLDRTKGLSAELGITQAIALGLANRGAEAEKAVKEIESERPEWDRAYLVHGLLLERDQPAMAAQKLRTALALGSQDVAARCALARVTHTAAPDPPCSCARGLLELLLPRCLN
jgi:tetratricopeptide (TPR) repeat protein